MRVKKRNGTLQNVSFDKITSRLRRLCWGLKLDETILAQKVIQGVFDGVSTSRLDELAAEEAFSLESVNLEFGILAARILVSNLHKNTTKNIAELAARLYNNISQQDELPMPLLSHEVFTIIQENADFLNSLLEHDRDFNYDYFGMQTLCSSYLLKINGNVVERPQMMLMRYSLEIHRDNMERVAETYKLLAQRKATPASPSLFNAGTNLPQLSSCFLLTMREDSVDAIYDTLKQCAQISRCAGGVGLSIRHIRGKGSFIRGTNGVSDGIGKMLCVFAKTFCYINQGGRRPGAGCAYLQTHHCDIETFLDLKKNTGSEENRARELFYALWISDLFMKRVKTDGDWSLFCPNSNRELFDTYGQRFEELYTEAEKNPKLVRKTMKARDLWESILCSQIETGGPFFLYADAANQKSNQQHLGFISQSNLCTEIIQYTSPTEVAVCNLSSIILPTYVKNGEFDFKELEKVMHVVVRNLDTTVTRNFYPVPEAKLSNELHRPMGIGVQGLADTFMLLRLPFDSPEAMQLNIDIFETMYFAACTASAELAVELGSHPSFQGSPMSKGKFQFDMWGVKTSSRYDWEPLRAKIMATGVRNSLFLAQMPTASTAHINGTIESTEPLNSNIYTRRTQTGDFTCLNKHLVRDLMKLGLWSVDLKNEIIANDGSVQNIDCIPDNLKALYKTAWEIKLRVQIDHSAQRAPFICQSQSLNFHMANPTKSKLTAAHFHAWESGLKTGMYYLRTQAAADAQKVTIDPSVVKHAQDQSDKRARAADETKEDDVPVGVAKRPKLEPVDRKRLKQEHIVVEGNGEETVCKLQPKPSNIVVDGGVCTRAPDCFSCGS